MGLNKQQEIYDLINQHMSNDFAKYVDEYVGDLIVKSDKTYWKAHTDEQAYEEELNEMCSLLDELYDCFAKIKENATSKYKKMPKWGYIAEEGMNLINSNR